VELGLILREEYTLNMYENKVLRRIFGPERRSWRMVEKKCIMRSFII
jgi:hypothetical protein